MSHLFVLLLAVTSPCLLSAQDVASMNGVVADTSGAVLPNTSVILVNTQTGKQFKVITNKEGFYRFAAIPAGAGYTVTFSAPGFSDLSVTDLQLNVASSRTQNATLHVGAKSEQVQISGSAGNVTLNTEDASIGNNYDVKHLNDLPVQERDSPVVLFALQPGITGGGGNTTGAREDQANITLDGLDVNDFRFGGIQGVIGNAPVDSVQEFRGTVAGFTADSGPSGGGQFQMVTRSGTNEWHGDLNEYHRDNSTTANDWFNDMVGIRAPKLVQNQFGGALGGPIKHDRAFFFFDYYNSRIASASSTTRTVPLPSFAAGNVSYINNGIGCTDSSRLDTTPACISQMSPAQVRALDPAGIGISPAFFALLKSRYPAANDLTLGDGVNTGGFRFNAPAPNYVTTYVGRVDYNLTPKIKIFGRGTVTRENSTSNVQQFPGDPPALTFLDRSYGYVAGMLWQIAGNKVNNFSYGVNNQDQSFQAPQSPLGVNQVFMGGIPTPLLDYPYALSVATTTQHIPITQVQDDLNWQLGTHSLSFGGTFKGIREREENTPGFNLLTLGLGGQMYGLSSSLRPADLLANSTPALMTYDSAFAAALGRIGSISSVFNYDATGAALPQSNISTRTYKHYQTLLYLTDAWKVTPHLTLNYGLNYQIFSVPYEVHGLQSVQNFGFDDYFASRVTQSISGGSGPTAVPLITYVLGGSANHGPAFYAPEYKNFAPRFAFAYNPGFDPRTVFNGSAGIVYDRTITPTLLYNLDNSSYLFRENHQINYGNAADPSGSLKNDPRLDVLPMITPPPASRPPFQPYVDAAGTPQGLIQNQINAMIDPLLKTPYSIVVNFGLQHEFPGAMIWKASYVGRFGRQLLAPADASQLIDFPDVSSGQMMSAAMANITTQLRAGADSTNLPAQPWFEHQVTPGVGVTNGYPNNTSYVATMFQSLVLAGDFARSIQQIAPLLGYNVGMGAQFAENMVYTNKGFSTYNGLLMSLQKNLTRGLQFDLNYTWSHSMDNVSTHTFTTSSSYNGTICDALRPRACRGNSDFDQTHTITGDFTYALPFGRGRTFAGRAPWGLDKVIGGWDVSGITSWSTGVAYTALSGASVAGLANNAPAIFNGNTAALKRHIHKTAAGQLQLFADPNAAVNAFQGPVGLNVGSRNMLRGPQFFDLDAGLAKTFTVLPKYDMALKFRADAFNVLNHPNFGGAYNNITDPGTFGQLTSAGTPRVIQLSLRLEF